MSDDLIKAINDLITANNKLNEKVNGIHADIDGLKQYFESLGDFTVVMQNILTEAMDKTNLTSQITAETLKRAGDFYKHTVSNKYAHQNIMQEWFSDVVIDVIAEFSDYNKNYIFDWLNLKFRDFTITHDEQQPSALEYTDRVDFGESIFLSAVEELGMSEKGLFVLRSLYIPYSSLYYLHPMSEYPYMDKWYKQLEKYKTLT